MKFIKNILNKLHLFFVGCKFKTTDELTKEELKILRENDWYYQHSWFSSYFWDKLKRKTMNVIYKLYTSIEEFFLEKYLVEFYFFTEPSNSLETYNKKHKTNYLGDFKCYLPILFMVRNYDELESLVGIINGQLYDSFGCRIIQINISDKIGSEEMIKHKIEISTNKLKGYKTGELDILTFTPKPTDRELEIKYQRRSDKYNFQILKSGPNLLRDKFSYIVKFYKNTTEA